MLQSLRPVTDSDLLFVNKDSNIVIRRYESVNTNAESYTCGQTDERLSLAEWWNEYNQREDRSLCRNRSEFAYGNAQLVHWWLYVHVHYEAGEHWRTDNIDETQEQQLLIVNKGM